VDPGVIQTTVSVTAMGLTLGSFVLLFNGGALPLGTSFRSSIEPLLRSLRELTPLSRPELADATVLLAIGFAGWAAVFDSPLAGVMLMVLMAWARPVIRQATREEHKLLALASSFSIDLVIGVYVPMVAAQLLLRNFFIATSMLLIVVALSWPAGGDSLGARRWRLAPVTP
jgi:hypothetical protein